MSKFVKNLIVDQIKKELSEVQDCVLVNVIGLDAGQSGQLRDRLHEKSINIRVVKKSMAIRATEGTDLAPAFEGVGGSVAVCWGGNDFVSMVKELVELDKDENFEAFSTCGGVLDGEALTPAAVAEISKWPTPEEVLATIVGQLLSPGATLAAQLIGPGGTLASQISEIDGSGASAEEEAPTEEEAPVEEAATAEEAEAEESVEESAEESAEEAAEEEAAEEEAAEEAAAEEPAANAEEEDAEEASEE